MLLLPVVIWALVVILREPIEVNQTNNSLLSVSQFPFLFWVSGNHSSLGSASYSSVPALARG